jgi:hypothetical protein
MNAIRSTILLVLFFLAGCDMRPYEMKEDNEGRIVRLNKWTGEMVILQGDGLIKVENRQVLAKTKAWSAIDIPELGKATLKTRWREGILSYQFSVELESMNTLKNVESLTVTLYDQDGFKIVQLTPHLTDFSKKGNLIQARAEGSTPCCEQDYKNAASWIARKSRIIDLTKPSS